MDAGFCFFNTAAIIFNNILQNTHLDTVFLVEKLYNLQWILGNLYDAINSVDLKIKCTDKDQDWQQWSNNWKLYINSITSMWGIIFVTLFHPYVTVMPQRNRSGVICPIKKLWVIHRSWQGFSTVV